MMIVVIMIMNVSMISSLTITIIITTVSFQHIMFVFAA